SHPPTSDSYSLSLHDALPIFGPLLFPGCSGCSMGAVLGGCQEIQYNHGTTRRDMVHTSRCCSTAAEPASMARPSSPESAEPWTRSEEHTSETPVTRSSRMPSS